MHILAVKINEIQSGIFTTSTARLDRVWHEVFEASKNYDICEKYINDLLDKIENKAKYPKSASPLYYEDLFTGYYYIRFKAYLAFYRIKGDKLLVDRVLEKIL